MTAASIGTPGPAWHLDRVAFECLLRDQAIASGARILPDTRVVHTRRTAGGAWTVTTRGGEGTSRHETSVIVDAGGRNGRDPLGRLRVTNATDMLLATAFIFAAPLAAPSPNWTLVESCPGGWRYSAPLPASGSSVIFFSDRDSPHRHETDVHALAALTGARLTIDRIPRGAAVQPCRRAAALGCAAQDDSLSIPVGDAALALDSVRLRPARRPPHRHRRRRRDLGGGQRPPRETHRIPGQRAVDVFRVSGGARPRVRSGNTMA